MITQPRQYMGGRSHFADLRDGQTHRPAEGPRGPRPRLVAGSLIDQLRIAGAAAFSSGQAGGFTAGEQGGNDRGTRRQRGMLKDSTMEFHSCLFWRLLALFGDWRLRTP